MERVEVMGPRGDSQPSSHTKVGLQTQRRTNLPVKYLLGKQINRCRWDAQEVEGGEVHVVGHEDVQGAPRNRIQQLGGGARLHRLSGTRLGQLPRATVLANRRMPRRQRGRCCGGGEGAPRQQLAC